MPKKNKAKIVVSIMLLVILAALAGAFVYYAGVLKKERQDNEEWEMALSAVQIDNPDMPDEYRALAATNPEIYAWIEIPGTDISYPIVQPADNSSKYLDHDAYGRESETGAIFTQTYNSKGFSDPDTVLYGNCMEDGSMFGELLEYEDPSFFKEHREIKIYLPERTLAYQIAATYIGDDSHVLLTRDLSVKEDFQKHIEEILEQRGLRTNVDKDMAITVNDRLLTLSTGHPSSGEARFLVRAVLCQ